jgi:hypothetical protein
MSILKRFYSVKPGCHSDESGSPRRNLTKKLLAAMQLMEPATRRLLRWQSPLAASTTEPVVQPLASASPTLRMTSVKVCEGRNNQREEGP